MTLSTKALVIAGGAAAVLLVSSYGLGYVKGKQNRPAEGTLIERKADTAEKSHEKTRSVKDITSEQDIVEERVKLPDVVLPDGSVKSRTHISRRLAKQETEQASVEKQKEAQVVEKIVEVKVPVPGPCPNVVVPPFGGPAAQPRFTFGPSVGRNFKLDKTVFGAGGGVRLGPVWLRVAADTDPSVTAGAEVQF